MSRAMKTLWIVIGCVFAVGIVLTAVGFALGATGGVWADRRGLHFGTGDVKTLQLADDNTEPFTNVDIKLISADVEFVVADTFGYDFNYSGTDEPTIEVVNNTLKVIEADKTFSIQFMGFWRSFYQTSKLTVYMPEGASLDTVGLATASGSTSFTSSAFNIDTLNCQSASGDIDLSNLNLAQLSLDVASGDVSIEHLTAKNSDINMISGVLSCEDVVINNLQLDMTSGNVDFEGEIVDSLRVRMTSGDADFDLRGSEENYIFDFDRVSGSIRVNGKNIENLSWLLDGSRGKNESLGHIDVDTISGSVSFNFN